VADVQRGTIIVALTCCAISFLHIFPIRRKGALIQQLSLLQS
jgi:hypothetical protein